MTKHIEIDEELYRYIASHTQRIGESASSILRRLLNLPPLPPSAGEAVEAIDVAPADVAPLSAGATIFEVLSATELANQKSAVARFLHILSALYQCHREQFSVVLQITGRDRRYFGTTEAELAASGSSTNPKQIPDSPYFVVTNNNTTRKKSMLAQVALELGYTEEQAEQIKDLL